MQLVAGGKVAVRECQSHCPPLTSNGRQRGLITVARDNIAGSQADRVTHRERFGQGSKQTRIDVVEVGVGQIETIVTAGCVTSRGRRAGRIEDRVATDPVRGK
jgi:hypothetical protein